MPEMQSGLNVSRFTHEAEETSELSRKNDISA
jgi:hypothetical protein